MLHLFKNIIRTTDKHIILNFFKLKIQIKKRDYYLRKELEYQRELILNNLNITELKPTTGKLRESQLMGVEILKRVKKVCDENNFKYWLDSGTLLGAVRHKGFIPWDNDLDICMLREDYQKVLPLLKNEFESDKNICIREQYFSHFQYRITNTTTGISLDIFPVDFYTKSELTKQDKKEITQNIKLATKEFSKKYNRKKITDPDKIQKAKRDLLEIQNKIVLNNQTSNCSDAALFFGIDYPSDAKELVFENSMVFPLKEIVFEGENYSCPNNVDAYLKNFYSDYMGWPGRFFVE